MWNAERSELRILHIGWAKKRLSLKVCIGLWWHRKALWTEACENGLFLVHRVFICCTVAFQSWFCAAPMTLCVASCWRLIAMPWLQEITYSSHSLCITSVVVVVITTTIIIIIIIRLHLTRSVAARQRATAVAETRRWRRRSCWRLLRSASGHFYRTTLRILHTADYLPQQVFPSVCMSICVSVTVIKMAKPVIILNQCCLVSPVEIFQPSHHFYWRRQIAG